jgi:hypothetical protein
MSKRQKRNDLLTLAEWSENMSRFTLLVANDPEKSRRYQRSLRFRAKRHAQIATVLRSQLGKSRE